MASLAAPWVIGGAGPSREQLTVAILILGVFAFASSASLVLSTFDISRLESSAVPGFESEADMGHVKEVEGVTSSKDAPDGCTEDVPV